MSAPSPTAYSAVPFLLPLVKVISVPDVAQESSSLKNHCPTPSAVVVAQTAPLADAVTTALGAAFVP